jgi:hypothetical protein
LGRQVAIFWVAPFFAALPVHALKGATMRKYKNKNKGKWPKEWQYVKMPRQMIFSKEWSDLSPAAKIIYFQMKGKYNSNNNGRIKLYYSELRKIKGLKCSRSISKGFRELEEKEWIKRTKLGGIYGRPNEYELTGKYDPSIAWDRLIASGYV